MLDDSNIEYDIRGLLEQAQAFGKIACSCETEKVKMPCEPRARFIAGIVNSSFACELFLKALLLHSGKGIKDLKKMGHNLIKLYRELKEVD